MFGQNPKRAVLVGDGTALEVQSIFRTLQGEGLFVGMPSIFIRLGGCNLACKFCDTDFENFKLLNIDIIIEEVIRLSGDSVKLVVITGGEPLRQPIELICAKLLSCGFMVQIETNGTLYRLLPKDVYIICSPKVGANGYSAIRQDLLPSISAIKFLISATIGKYSFIPEVGQTEYRIPVFLQPIDQYDELLNKQNTALAIKLAFETGYRLSLQTHKFIGIE
jgi:7-carboxy-7-deazaguanine synthase